MSSTATVTVLFCDVVESTARLSRLGDDAGDDFRRALFAELRVGIRAAGGTEVKNLGDGLMVVFPQSAIAALRCAGAMHDVADRLDPGDPVQLRVGLSMGEVGEEDGDWFGTPVVQAARLCARAAPGQTLAPALIRTVVGSRASHHDFRDLGSTALKGLPGELAIVEVDGDPDSADQGDDVPPTVEQSLIGGRPSIHRRWPRRSVAVGWVAVAALLIAGGIALVNRDADSGQSGGDGEASVNDAMTRPRGYTPRYTGRECDDDVSESVPEATCADLIVPQSRTAPDGSTVEIGVVEAHSAGSANTDPVVLVDVNEPIASTSLTEVADVYEMSLRGFTSDASTPLDCPEMRDAWPSTLAAPADDVTAIGRRVEAAGACAARLRNAGVDLDGYTPADVAADIRDLVLAAHLGRVTLVAGGPTTIAAVSFARANPGMVGALVLTNPVEPGDSPQANPAGSSLLKFERVAQMCLDDDGCAEAFPDLAARYAERVASLSTDPVRVSTSPLTGGPPVEVLLDGRRAGVALKGAMANSGQIGLVPTAIVGASNELTAAAAIDEEMRLFASAGSRAAAFLSYTCSYDAYPNRTAEVTNAALEPFDGSNDPTFAQLCQEWGVRSVYDELRRPLTGDVPVLMTQGGLAVAGVNDWAGTMAELLDDATLVRMSTMSEDVVFSAPPCLRALRNRFVQDHSAELDVADCEAKSPPVDFVGVS